jgi:Uncharacterized protein conserved in bacteria (DUF2188)
MKKSKGSVYVVFPAALFDGWEVVKEPSDESVGFDTQDEAIAYAKAQARSDGGATIWFENWYGDREGALEVPPRAGTIAGLESSIFSWLLRRRYTTH